LFSDGAAIYRTLTVFLEATGLNLNVYYAIIAIVGYVSGVVIGLFNLHNQ